MKNNSSGTKTRYIDRIWLVIPILLAFVLLNLTPLREGDTWWHLKVGEEIVLSRSIPEVDTFSFTAFGLPFYFSRSWLSDVILFLAYQWGSLSALVLLQSIVGATTVGFSLFTAITRGADTRFASMAAMIGFLGLYPFSTARPVIFSFLCFAVILWVLYKYRYQERNFLWVLPLVMVLWVNLNSAWVTGLFLVGLFAALNMVEMLVRNYGFGEIKSLLFWSVLSLLVVLVNPFGPGIWEDIFTATSNPVNQIYVSEWQPTTITISFAWPYFLILGLLVISLAYSKNRLDWIELVLMLVFIGLSLRYQRLLPFFYIIAIPTLAKIWSGIKIPGLMGTDSASDQPSRPGSRGSRWVYLAFVVLLVLVTVSSFPQIRLYFQQEEEKSLVDEYFPSGAADYIASDLDNGARILSQPEWGGYLVWRLYPLAQVFVDGRVEQFPLDVWEDYYLVATGAPGWQDILERYKVDYLVLSKVVHQVLINQISGTNISCPYEDTSSLVCMVSQ